MVPSPGSGDAGCNLAQEARPRKGLALAAREARRPVAGLDLPGRCAAARDVFGARSAMLGNPNARLAGGHGLGLANRFRSGSVILSKARILA
jgi:hypothetical protein